MCCPIHPPGKAHQQVARTFSIMCSVLICALLYGCCSAKHDTHLEKLGVDEVSYIVIGRVTCEPVKRGLVFSRVQMWPIEEYSRITNRADIVRLCNSLSTLKNHHDGVSTFLGTLPIQVYCRANGSPVAGVRVYLNRSNVFVRDDITFRNKKYYMVYSGSDSASGVCEEYCRLLVPLLRRECEMRELDYFFRNMGGSVEGILGIDAESALTPRK